MHNTTNRRCKGTTLQWQSMTSEFKSHKSNRQQQWISTQTTITAVITFIIGPVHQDMQVLRAMSVLDFQLSLPNYRLTLHDNYTTQKNWRATVWFRNFQPIRSPGAMCFGTRGMGWLLLRQNIRQMVVPIQKSVGKFLILNSEFEGAWQALLLLNMWGRIQIHSSIPWCGFLSICEPKTRQNDCWIKACSRSRERWTTERSVFTSKFFISPFFIFFKYYKHNYHNSCLVKITLF